MRQMIVASNSSMVAINGRTAERMAVIAQRTGNDFLAVSKAMLIETLKAKMASGVAHFIFKKKDGTLREAWGTTQPSLARAMTSGRGVSRENFKTTAFYSITDGAWRSFRWDSLIQVF